MGQFLLLSNSWLLFWFLYFYNYATVASAVLIISMERIRSKMVIQHHVDIILYRFGTCHIYLRWYFEIDSIRRTLVKKTSIPDSLQGLEFSWVQVDKGLHRRSHNEKNVRECRHVPIS